MSEFVRTAHARIKKHPRYPYIASNAHANVDPALISQRSRLLSDLSDLPEPCSASKVFVLDETDVGIPGVRLFVRSEEQPYLRGTINALECLVERHGLEELKACGIVGQECSPHAEDMAIAASAYGIPTYVTGHRQAEEDATPRERVSKVVLAVEEMHIDGQKAPVIMHTAPVPFPLHHHAEVIHGQGTIALQLEQEMASTFLQEASVLNSKAPQFDAVISDIGNGCTLSGICMAFSGERTQVFGAAPSSGFWEHAASLKSPDTSASDHAKSDYWQDVEIPMGAVPWSVFTSSGSLAGVFDVDDKAMEAASLEVFEHSGLDIRPDEAAPLAVVLYNKDFRRIVTRRSRGGRGWNIGIVLQPRKSTLTGHVAQLGAEISAFEPFLE